MYNYFCLAWKCKVFLLGSINNSSQLTSLLSLCAAFHIFLLFSPVFLRATLVYWTWVWSRRRTTFCLFYVTTWREIPLTWMCLFRPLRALFDTRARTHAPLEENRPRMAWECFLLPLWLLLVTRGTVFIKYVDLSLFPVSFPLHLSTFCLFFSLTVSAGF